jgi:hypothetical protein
MPTEVRATGATTKEAIPMTGRPETGGPLKVTLIPSAEADLRLLQERTNLSRTDLANRAITLYEFIDAQMRAGIDMLARDNKTGQTQLVQFLLDAPAGQAAAAAAPPSTGGAPAGREQRAARHRRQPLPSGRTSRVLAMAGLTGQEAATR